MFALKSGDIIPGKGVGVLRLGMTFDEVRSISDNFEMENRDLCLVLVGEDVNIYIDAETDLVFQIVVKGGFSGRYNGWLGLGMTLGDIVSRGHTYHEELDVYVLDEEPNMSMESDGEWVDPEDPDGNNWDERRTPIHYIAVYDNESWPFCEEN